MAINNSLMIARWRAPLVWGAICFYLLNHKIFSSIHSLAAVHQQNKQQGFSVASYFFNAFVIPPLPGLVVFLAFIIISYFMFRQGMPRPYIQLLLYFALIVLNTLTILAIGYLSYTISLALNNQPSYAMTPELMPWIHAVLQGTAQRALMIGVCFYALLRELRVSAALSSATDND
ncbi:MAG: hypothetical protein P4L95_19845 [Rouxiella aceris]|uniref:hypothetical protein n=1 Tax=Rouxiella aceris TaxID=2703884 RepID=UPI00284085CA|nr:hypothetical protein [Rouxiella aceris]MDR3434119.1 hypothetical protein [Rouxiella aceris]